MNGADGAQVTYSGTQRHVDLGRSPPMGSITLAVGEEVSKGKHPMTLPKTISID